MSKNLILEQHEINKTGGANKIKGLEEKMI